MKIIKKIIKGFLIFIGSIVALVAITISVIAITLSNNYENLTKVDEQGTLYYLDYVGDYDNPIINLPCDLIENSGCSVFSTLDENNNPITCRNYDLAHTDDNDNVTGLNVIYTLRPKDKYASINIADAAWISLIGLNFYKGALDNDDTYKDLLSYLPYLTMDGMNEKGLCVSILALDLKDGEEATNQNDEGKEKVMITKLLRLLLDETKDVDEAIEYIRNINIVSTFSRDYHLFISDANNKQVVVEWRYGNLYLTYQDVVTNCLVAFDDAEDCYYGDTLKEAYVPLTNSLRTYKFGYGHGFERYKTIIKALDEHRIDNESYTSKMTTDEAINTLQAIYQGFDGSSITSYTQYSAIYHNNSRTVDVYIKESKLNKYTFTF